MALVTETRGPTGTASTEASSLSTQTTTFWSPVALSVSAVLWKVPAGTFEFRIDGTLISTKTTGGNVEQDFMAGVSALPLDTGPHVLSLTRTAGTNWRWYDGNAYADEWFHIHNWAEHSHLDTTDYYERRHPCIRVTAQLENTNYTKFAPPVTTRTGSTSVPSRQTWTVTSTTARYATGIVLAQYPAGARGYELYVDGELVGTTAGNDSGDFGTGLTGTSEPSWIRFPKPILLEAGVPRTFLLWMSGIYLDYSSASSYSNGGLTYGEWQESTGKVLAHQLITAPIAAPQAAEVNEIRGIFTESEASTYTDYSGALATQTFSFYTLADCLLDELWIDVNAGTYECRVDGVLVSTKSPAAQGPYDFLDGIAAVTITRTVEHEVELTRTTGATTAWRQATFEADDPSYRDGWLFLHGVPHESILNDSVVARLRARFDPDTHLRVARPTEIAAVQPFEAYEQYLDWTVEFNQPSRLHGVVFRRDSPTHQAARLYVEGVQVGANDPARSWGQDQLIMLDTPYEADAGVVLDLQYRTNTGGGTLVFPDWMIAEDATYVTDGVEFGMPASPHQSYGDAVPYSDVIFEALPPTTNTVDMGVQLIAQRVTARTVDLGLDLEAATPTVGSTDPVIWVNHFTGVTNSTGGSALVITTSGLVVGDLLVATVQSRGGTDLTPPAGWTVLHEGSPGGSNPSYTMLAYKFVDGTEGSTFSFSVAGSTSPGKKAGAIVQIRNADTTSPITYSVNAQTSSASGLTYLGVTVPRDGSALWAVNASTNGANAIPTGETLIWSQSTTSGSGTGQRGWYDTSLGQIVDAGPTGSWSGIADSQGTTTYVISVQPGVPVPPLTVAAGTVTAQFVPFSAYRVNAAFATTPDIGLDLEPVKPPVTARDAAIGLVLHPATGPSGAGRKVLRTGYIPIGPRT